MAGFFPMKATRKGIFITFEGCEGSGKSTHSAIISRKLKARGRKVVQTREPGGTLLAEAVRRILLHPESRINPLAELFLYEAARAQHISEVIKPALKKGMIVVCDRFSDATIAYQGYGRRLDVKTIRLLNSIASESIKPDLTVYLDIPAADGLMKARKLKKGTDRLELEAVSFHNRVRKGYLALAKTEPKRIRVVKVQDSIEKTSALVVKALKSKLNV